MSGNKLNFLVSGGGTGGHIFPALSIANEIRRRMPDANILFVGAEGRMEMERVPAAGYEIKGLPVAGFDRRHLLKNVKVVCKLIKSLMLAKKILKDFKPDIAIGVGGYASGPMLKEAQKHGIPTLLQEQNSYAGVTNKLLAKKATKICVAYDNMERFFPKDKIVMTGNPVRQNVLNVKLTRQEARKAFGLDPDKKTILLVGGSLGARTVNESVRQHFDTVKANPDIQFIWQTGKYYNEEMKQALDAYGPLPNLKQMDFIADMGAAYKASDLVISRAGASSISEFCLIGKPVILVPSPNVAEDHQTKNAMALVNKNAAVYVKDSEAPDVLLKQAISIVRDDKQLASLAQNIAKLGLKDSADIIADEVIKLAQHGTERY